MQLLIMAALSRIKITISCAGKYKKQHSRGGAGGGGGGWGGETAVDKQRYADCQAAHDLS